MCLIRSTAASTKVALHSREARNLSIRPFSGAEDRVASASKKADVGAISPLRADAPGDTTSPVNKTKKGGKAGDVNGSKSKREERAVLHPTLSTLNPQPLTPNPEPQTLNPEP